MPTDLFGRTTSYGLGTDGTFTYVWVERDTGFATAADSTFHVDGSKLVIPGDDGNTWDSYIITGPTPPKSGSVSFDIYIPAMDDPTNTDWFGPVFLHLAWSDVTAFGGTFYPEVLLGIEMLNTGTYPPQLVNFGPYGDGNFAFDSTGKRVSNVVEVELGNWYTAKVTYQMSDDGASLCGYKLWKTADTEPTDHQFVYETNADWGPGDQWSDGYDGNPWLDFYYSGGIGDETYLDNLTFDATPPTGLYRSRTFYALIKSHQDLSVCDPMSITSTYGLGSEYPFIPGSTDPMAAYNVNYTSSSGGAGAIDDETQAFVQGDGSKIVMPTTVTSMTHNAYSILGRRAVAGTAQFDFFVPAPNPSTNGLGGGIDVIFDTGAYANGFGFFILNTVSGGSLFQIYILHRLEKTAAAVDAYIPTNNTWYTLKLLYDDVGRQVVLLKAQGADDSAALLSSELDMQAAYPDTLQDYVVGRGTGDRVIFTRVANGHNLAFDNFCWTAERLTLDAVFVVPTGQFSFTIRAVTQKVQTGSFSLDAQFIQTVHSITANAVIRAARAGSFVVNAAVSAVHFSLDAFIVDNALWRHYRDRDHSGTLLDTSVVLTQPLGPWAAGTTLHEVLLDLWQRAENLE